MKHTKKTHMTFSLAESQSIETEKDMTYMIKETVKNFIFDGIIW